eukprot:3073800-Prymnesium_polylepis.2
MQNGPSPCTVDGHAVTATVIFWPEAQCEPTWHAIYIVPGLVATAEYRLGVVVESPPPCDSVASAVALEKSQESYAVCEGIR